MLTQETRTVLKSLIPVNNSMIIGPVMHGCDEFKSILFRANLNKLEGDLTEFGIFDASNFLGALDLQESPSITIEDNLLVAKDENSTLKFLTSYISNLDEIQINPKIIDSTQVIESILEFDFGTDLINKIKKAAGIFKTFDTVFITSDGTNIELITGAKDSFSKSNNSFSISLLPTINKGKKFEIALPLDSLLKIPAMDYTLGIKYNEEKDKYRVILENELLVFIVSIKK